jgi:phosphoglycerate kinase
MIIAAGSLAMALRKALAQKAGTSFSIGKAEYDTSYPAYIGPNRIEQATRILDKCAQRNIEVVLPIDYVLEDGTVSSVIPPTGAQLDVGPATRSLFREAIHRYIGLARDRGRSTVFYNGVFGKFEDPLFQAGTREFIPLLKEMTDAGIATYVGGGEGRSALKQFGSLRDVTHAFTCGGTVLKSLTDRHIGFVKAMYLQNTVSRVAESGRE